MRVQSLLLAEITSAKPVLSMLLTSSPLSNILRISVHAKPAAAHRALLFHFQPLTKPHILPRTDELSTLLGCSGQAATTPGSSGRAIGFRCQEVAILVCLQPQSPHFTMTYHLRVAQISDL